MNSGHICNHNTIIVHATTSLGNSLPVTQYYYNMGYTDKELGVKVHIAATSLISSLHNIIIVHNNIVKIMMTNAWLEYSFITIINWNYNSKMYVPTPMKHNDCVLLRLKQ